MTRTNVAVKAGQVSMWKNPWTLGAMVFIAVLTAVAYWPVFDAGKEFVNWDDDKYILGQPLVESTSSQNIKRMFDTKSTVAANYHPLTMLTLAIDARRGKMTMKPFMQTNLALHAINSFLVFIFIYLLMDRSVFLAFVSALFFAVHPMHVESVAWASARKDVLYTLFYLLALIAYLRYLDTGKLMFFALTILTFLLSCLSKPMAVTLPILLLAIDAFKGRLGGHWKRALVEKFPLIAVSLYFGLLTVSIQAAVSGGLVDTTTYTQWQRFVFAFYAVLQYCFKLVLPINLSAYYPYPNELTPSNIPGFMIAGAGCVVAALAALLMFWRRRPGPRTTLAMFGVAFYLITASLVLQVVSVGGASIADRYTYMPYLGLFLVIGVLLEQLSDVIGSKRLAIGLVCAAGIVFAVGSRERVGVWQNSETLWSDVIRQYPYEFGTQDGVEVVTKRGVMYAYSNRGIHYIKTKRPEKAIPDLGILYRARVQHPDSFRALGVAYQMTSQHPQAIEAFSVAIMQGDVDYQAYRARGASYLVSGQPERALEDFAIVLQKQPGDALTQGAIREAQAMLASRSIQSAGR